MTTTAKTLSWTDPEWQATYARYLGIKRWLAKRGFSDEAILDGMEEVHERTYERTGHGITTAPIEEILEAVEKAARALHPKLRLIVTNSPKPKSQIERPHLRPQAK